MAWRTNSPFFIIVPSSSLLPWLARLLRIAPRSLWRIVPFFPGWTQVSMKNAHPLVNQIRCEFLGLCGHPMKLQPSISYVQMDRFSSCISYFMRKFSWENLTRPSTPSINLTSLGPHFSRHHLSNNMPMKLPPSDFSCSDLRFGAMFWGSRIKCWKH